MNTSQKVLGGVLLGIALLVVTSLAMSRDSSGPARADDPDFSCTMEMWHMVYDTWSGSPHWMLTDEQKDLGFDLAVVYNRLTTFEGYSDHQAHMAVLPYVKEACNG